MAKSQRMVMKSLTFKNFEEQQAWYAEQAKKAKAAFNKQAGKTKPKKEDKPVESYGEMENLDLNAMTKKEIVAYAKEEYGVDLDINLKKDALIELLTLEQ